MLVAPRSLDVFDRRSELGSEGAGGL